MRCGVDENGAVQVGPNGFVANRSETHRRHHGRCRNMPRAKHLPLTNGGCAGADFTFRAMIALGRFETYEFDVWRRVQAVNVESELLLTQAFAPGSTWRRRGPRSGWCARSRTD